MTRPTVAELAAVVADLQAEVAELRAVVQRSERWQPIPAPSPVSTPIDFKQMAVDLGASQAYADPDEWGPSVYI